jgi:hypothetical protein
MKDNTDLHPAVQLLLKRMESHPEEFTERPPSNMWRLTKKYEDYFTEEERTAVTRALSGLMKDVMHKEVLHEMLVPEERLSRVDAVGWMNTGRTSHILKLYEAAQMAKLERKSVLAWGPGE